MKPQLRQASDPASLDGLEDFLQEGSPGPFVHGSAEQAVYVESLKKEAWEWRVKADLLSERLDRAHHRLEGASVLIGCLRSRIETLELDLDRLETEADRAQGLRQEVDALHDRLEKAFWHMSELESTWWYKLSRWFSGRRS